MADFIVFDAGADLILDEGVPANAFFALSTKSVDGTTPFAVTDVIATSDGEITGTGYTRQTQVTPAASSRDVAFVQVSWDTDVNTDWPAAVRSCVLMSTSDDTGVMICAWNLQAGAVARDMSAAETIERFTATLSA